MITIKQATSAMQEGLDFPVFESLSDGRCFRLLVQSGDEINNDLGLSGRPWNFQNFILTVKANEDFHAIVEVGDFTVPFAVETMDTSDPSFQVRPVRIVDFTDLERWAGAGTNLLQSGNTVVKHTAAAVCFTEMPGQPGIRAARFGPKPNATADYNIFYTPNVIRPQSLQDLATKFPQYEQYLLLRAELAAIQYCDWQGKTPEENEAKRQRLRGDPNMPGTRAYRFGELKEQFTRQRRKVDQRNNTRLIGPGRYLRKL
jgi:hypothetical protein